MGLRTFLLLAAIALTSPPALAARSGPSWPAGAAGLTATCDAQLARYREAIAAIGRRGTRSPFAATVLALEDAAADTADALSAATFAWSVTTDAAVRDASRACRLRWRDASADTLADPKLFAAIASAAPPRDAADRALARAWKSAMMRGGALLAPAKRDEFLRLAHELDSLEDRFVTNLADDRTTIRAGRRTLPVDDGTFDEVLLRSGDAQLREAFERAYFRRAAAANVPLLERAIAVRDRMSHVLGYESWADYRLAAAAMGGLAQAQQFLAGAAAANAGARPAAGTPAWDAWRGSENEAPPRSAQSVLDAVAQPFGIRFAPAGAAPWSDDVPAYGVTDSATGANLGTLYLDLYRRSGKQTGETVSALSLARKGLPALAAIVASWTPRPDGTLDGDRAAALTGDVGRALAILLAQVPYATLAHVSTEARELDAAIALRVAGEPPASPRDVLRSIALAQIDAAFHSSGSHVDTTRLWAAGAAATFPPLYDPGTYPQAAIPDLMDGWDALEYVRPWSASVAQDVAAAGAERYRRDVLAPAGSRTLHDELRDLLGRDPKPVMP